jgi:hypothetical protein
MFRRFFNQAPREDQAGRAAPRIFTFWRQTRREKRANGTALSLFFGALLGANLGTTPDCR